MHPSALSIRGAEESKRSEGKEIGWVLYFAVPDLQYGTLILRICNPEILKKIFKMVRQDLE
jgi:hypothetical protein